MKEEKKVRGQKPQKEKPKKEKPQKEKPKYNMWQNSWFMIKLAWNAKEKKVLVLCLLTVILAVASNLVNLYISPTILAAVESKASVSELLLTILGFTGGIILLAAASAYVEANTLYGRVTVRSEIVAMLNKKAATTSYPNLDDEKFNKLLDKAGDATSSNWEATEAIWDTLTSLALNAAGLIIYASLLTSVQPILLLVILVTATLGYFINKHVKGYWYRHRDEVSVYTREINYLVNLARDYNAAKDIRIFGVKPWLDELMEIHGVLYGISAKGQQCADLGENCRFSAGIFAQWRGVCILDLSGDCRRFKRIPIPFVFFRGKRICGLGFRDSGKFEWFV